MDGDGPGPEFVEVQPSAHIAPGLRTAAIHEFGSDGAWLLLSMFWYGWRAFYDLAVAIDRGTSPVDTDGRRPVPMDLDFQIVKDLQVQGFLYASAEQFAGLMRAARAHISGTGSFFDTYVGRADLRTLIDSLQDFTREELGRMLGEPTDRDAVMRRLSTRPDETAAGGRVVLDPGSVDTVEAGSLLVPRYVIERGVAERVYPATVSMLDDMHANVGDLVQLIERPVSRIDGVEAQPLREVDNSFRHGLRLLFHDVAPERRVFRAVDPLDVGRDYAVDVYLPRRGEDVKFATVSCSPERTTEHLDVLRTFSIRTGQLARALIGHHALNDPGMLLSASDLEP